LDRLERAKLAGAVSVLIDIERDPIRKTQLVNLMSSLRSNGRLSMEELSLIEEIDIFNTTYV
jgi:hypothetical protein